MKMNVKIKIIIMKIKKKNIVNLKLLENNKYQIYK